MACITANGLNLEYESIGDPADTSLLLIMGFNMQLTAWDLEFCKLLADSGLHVIRFDNRDIGLSDRLTHLGQPAAAPIALRRLCALPAVSPYSLLDMAGDAIGLLDALQINRAHVVGASMGGMIGQLMAIHFPQHVASLCSMMATTGDCLQLWPKPRMRRALSPPPGPGIESLIQYWVRFWQAAASPDNIPDPGLIASRTREAYERSQDCSGRQRQLAAILAAPSRNRLLRSIRAPTQIIHGKDDPLIRVRAAWKLAGLIPGARISLIEGMGHDLPPHLFTKIAGLILKNAERGV